MLDSIKLLAPFVVLLFFLALPFFLIMRKVIRWYFCIDEVVELLRSIDGSLKQMPAAQAWRARMRAQGNKRA